MSYTPHTWVDNETIDAVKLNHIEEGISSAGSSNVAVVKVSATGYSSSTHTFGKLVYAYKENNTWVVQGDTDTDWYNIYGYTGPNTNILPPERTIVSSEVCPFIVFTSADEITTTGGVSNTAEPLYYGYGSLVNGGGYRITGSGSIVFVAT